MVSVVWFWLSLLFSSFLPREWHQERSLFGRGGGHRVVKTHQSVLLGGHCPTVQVFFTVVKYTDRDPGRRSRPWAHSSLAEARSRCAHMAAMAAQKAKAPPRVHAPGLCLPAVPQWALGLPSRPAAVSKAVMDIMHRAAWTCVFIYPGSRIAGSMLTMCSLLGHSQTVVPSSCTISRPHRRRRRVPGCLRPPKPCIFRFLDSSCPVNVKWHLLLFRWHLSVVSDVGHAFTCFRAVLFSGEMPVGVIAHLWIGLFGLCWWLIRVLYIFWMWILYLIYKLKIFSPILWLRFSLS